MYLEQRKSKWLVIGDAGHPVYRTCKTKSAATREMERLEAQTALANMVGTG